MQEPERLLRAALAEAKAQQTKWQTVVKALEQALGEPQGVQLELRENGNGTTRKPAGLSGTDLAEIALREAGRALHIRKLIQKLLDMGYVIEDPKRFQRSIYSGMRRQEHRFRQTAPNTFELVAKKGG